MYVDSAIHIRPESFSSCSVTPTVSVILSVWAHRSTVEKGFQTRVYLVRMFRNISKTSRIIFSRLWARLWLLAVDCCDQWNPLHVWRSNLSESCR